MAATAKAAADPTTAIAQSAEGLGERATPTSAPCTSCDAAIRYGSFSPPVRLRRNLSDATAHASHVTDADERRRLLARILRIRRGFQPVRVARHGQPGYEWEYGVISATRRVASYAAIENPAGGTRFSGKSRRRPAKDGNGCQRARVISTAAPAGCAAGVV